MDTDHNGTTEANKREHSSYWIGDVFFNGGKGWIARYIDTQPGRKDAYNICIGNEDDIVPILKGKQDIPEEMPERQKQLLESILEEMNGTTEPTARMDGLQRESNARFTRSGKTNPRQIKT